MSLIEPIVPTIWQRYKPWVIIAGLLMIIALVVAAVSIVAQTPPIKNLENFKEIGRDDLIIYFVNPVNLVRTPAGALAETLAAHYENAPTPDNPDAYKLNNTTWILTTWRIDCTNRTGERLEDRGLWRGKKVHKTFSKPKLEKPDRTRNLALAIDAVCGDTSPELEPALKSTQTASKPSYVWKGGNGCNLIGGGENERLCCKEHDFSYRTGGNMRDKWQADSELFKCIWKRNKFLAPFVFVGTNVGGLFAFHWGKQRNLKHHDRPNW
jgi:hypothetical protein